MQKNELNAWAEKLAVETRDEAHRFLRLGRRYYFLSYALMIVGVAASLAAGVAAMWPNTSQGLIGGLALVPAFTVTVAGRLRLVEKGNWFYGKSAGLESLSRTIELESLNEIDASKAREFVLALNQVKETASAQWAESLSFEFRNDESTLKTDSLSPGDTVSVQIEGKSGSGG